MLLQHGVMLQPEYPMESACEWCQRSEFVAALGGALCTYGSSFFLSYSSIFKISLVRGVDNLYQRVKVWQMLATQILMKVLAVFLVIISVGAVLNNLTYLAVFMTRWGVIKFMT